MKDFIGFFYNGYFKVTDPYPDQFDRDDIKKILSSFSGSLDLGDDQNVWFDKIKAIAKENGFADDMKEYKTSPESFKGSVADVSMFIRVAVTGRMNSPDLYSVMQILGADETKKRLSDMTESI